ncbi:MAG: hypothetical protein E6K54_02575 [Gammaproteobacteria bacterium]|nr:MAG: hypothetical protein E6K54_02575 [Gammaproteobacteria bacterium]
MPNVNLQIQLTEPGADNILESFIKTGRFQLIDTLVTAEVLNYFINYLKKLTEKLKGWDHRVYFENVTFNLNDSEQAYRDEKVTQLLDEIFYFSSRWSVIALDNVRVLQDENHYPLSSNVILELLTRFTPPQRSNLFISHQLIIKNTEFHSWCWIHFLITRPQFRTLVLELLDDDELEDNLMLLFESLHYAKIKVLEIKNTNLSLECYQALNELITKNYYIEELKINEPTDPESRVIFQEINECLSKDETGQQRFDRERFNQDEFLRLFNKVKNALEHETDEEKIIQFKKELKFILEQKKMEGNKIVREEIKFNPMAIIPKDHAVYYDHAEYIVGRLPLFRLDLNRSIDNQVNTLGYYLLEEALKNNDHFMMNCLLDNGTANLFEQQAGEKPLLLQIYENPDFKKVILDHIYSRQTLITLAQEVLKNYSESQSIMVELAYALINYTKRLEKIIDSYKLSGFERLLNRLRERFELANPSKQREQEFIEIYWRIGKSLTLFHNAGNVTVQSISNAQSTLDEIIAISEHADSGWLRGSELHYKLTKRLDLLKDSMDKNIKSLTKQAQESIHTVKINEDLEINFTEVKKEKTDQKTNIMQECLQNQTQFKTTLTMQQAMELKKISKNSEVLESEPGPSTRFSPRL